LTVAQPNLYNFSWLPDQGVQGAGPFERCNLPAGNYAIITSEKGNPACYLKTIVKLSAKQPCGDTMYVTIKKNSAKDVCVTDFLGFSANSYTSTFCGFETDKVNVALLQGSDCLTIATINSFIGHTLICVNVCDAAQPNVCKTVYILVTVNESGIIAIDDQYSVKIGKTALFTVLDNDIMPTLTPDQLNITKDPSHGLATVKNNSYIEYQPELNYCGHDLLTYQICFDGECDDADVNIDVTCNGLVVFTGFSPNGDGVNETFRIQELERFPNNELWIFNRWGNLIYHAQNYQNDWSGDWKGSLIPDGTYYYMLDDGEGNTFKGYFQVQR
jgi:gliding motility-associated-like protein